MSAPMTVVNAFSQSYAQARVKFLQAAAIASLPTESFNHPLPGRDGETLAMDVALDGPRDAQSLLIVSSACHGVEGFCGSGVQVFALHDSAWREKARAAGVAVLYIHALNPFGFSHLRRVTHEGVDLNRNFQDFSQPLPDNAAYRALHPLLLPEVWPPATKNIAALAEYIKTNGPQAHQAAITSGQYDFADGLFYGGRAPTWSNTTLRHVLRTYAQRAQRLGWIDLHTGLGPRGVGERIFACKDEAAALQRAKQWWGQDVTSIYDGSSTSANLSGLMWLAAYQECPQAEYTGIALEYGTVPLQEVLEALRAEHWLQKHPQTPAAQALQIKQQFRDAFYTDADDWKGMVVAQAREAMYQAVDGLRYE
jgi:Protein of unknown function (DUF2817)